MTRQRPRRRCRQGEPTHFSPIAPHQGGFPAGSGEMDGLRPHQPVLSLFARQARIRQDASVESTARRQYEAGDKHTLGLATMHTHKAERGSNRHHSFLICNPSARHTFVLSLFKDGYRR